MTRTNRPGPFVCVPEAAFSLPPAQFMLIAALCKFDETWASYATIAEWCGKSRRQTMRDIQALRDQGWVDCTAGGGRNGTNRIWLTAKAWEVPASRKNATPASDIHDTPAGDIHDTRGVTSMTPNPDQGIKTNKTPLTPQGGNQTGVGSIGENPQVKKTYEAMAGRGMKRNLESFLAIVCETGDASPAVVNRALLNLESSDRHTLTAETWEANLKKAKGDIAKEPAALRPLHIHEPGPEPQWLLDRREQWKQEEQMKSPAPVV